MQQEHVSKFSFGFFNLLILFLQVNGALEDAFGGGDVDAEADSVYDQICAEQGIAMEGDAMGVGTGAITGEAKPAAVANDNEADDLQKRLDNLN